MLPDFLALKRELSRDRQAGFARSEDPLLSSIQTRVIHEGDGITLLREDGSQETLGYEKLAVPVEVKLSEIESKGDKAIQDAFAEARQRMSRAQKELFFRRLSETVPGFDAGGRQLTAELMLESWERVEFEFDDQGNWVQPQIVCGPALASRLEAEYQRLNTDPELRARMTELLTRKRKEWDAREGNRKLVD